jgi:hypothetical protein
VILLSDLEMRWGMAVALDRLSPEDAEWWGRQALEEIKRLPLEDPQEQLPLMGFPSLEIEARAALAEAIERFLLTSDLQGWEDEI